MLKYWKLARNILVHAGKGLARIEEVSEGAGARYWKGSPEQRVGIRILFEDSGPGIADVARVLAGGFSTARSMGLGVSGSRRLVDDFTLESAPGEGTRVTILKWKRF